ncbi:sodium/proline symporter [Pseudomonadota bacterium]
MIAVYSFLGFLFCFIAIGLLSIKKRKQNTDDYHIASREISPWLVALSAAASKYSGFMFIGMIGMTYIMGLASMWIMIGAVGGNLLVYLFILPKFKNFSEKHRFASYGKLISEGTGKEYKMLKYVTGFITIAFLGAYAAAQLTAGSKALHVIFDWNYNTGAIIGAIIVLLYCFAGGIRASIWTDAAQSLVMILAMSVLLIASLIEIGGIKELWLQLKSIDENLTLIFPPNLLFGALLFVLGWITMGFITLGQPHIMIRYMTLRSNAKIKRVGIYYFSWVSIFTFVTICVGLVARVLLPEVAAFDEELALPKLSQNLLPEVLVGLVLAGIFASIMSTADSLILSCSATVSKDILPKIGKSYTLTKAVTLIITVFVLGIALYGNKNVFSLVILSFGVIGVAFTPIVILYLFKQKPSDLLSVLMILGGVSTVLYWRESGYNTSVFEGLPGLGASFAIFFIGKMLRAIRK